MRLFSTLVIVVAIGSLFCIASVATADTLLFQDNFEGQTLGASLTACIPPIGDSYLNLPGNSASAIGNVTTFAAPGATNSGKFAGQSGVSGGVEDDFKITDASRVAATGKVATFAFNLFVPAFASNSHLALLVHGLAADSGDNAINVQLWGDGTISHYDGSAGLNYVTGGYALDTWVPVNIVADFGAKTYHATVGTTTWSAGFRNDYGNPNYFQYLAINDGATGQPFYVDNVSISVVPEPSMVALSVSGLIGLLAYAWRKRK